jgi:hypothetical protein
MSAISPGIGVELAGMRGGGPSCPFLVVELRVLVLRRLVQNEASGLRGLVEAVTDQHDGHPQGSGGAKVAISSPLRSFELQMCNKG